MKFKEFMRVSSNPKTMEDYIALFEHSAEGHRYVPHKIGTELIKHYQQDPGYRTAYFSDSQIVFEHKTRNWVIDIYPNHDDYIVYSGEGA